MTVTAAEAAYDVVGRYAQDEINGLTPELLDRFLDLAGLDGAATVLDAMAGDGNLTLRLHAYCARRGIPVPAATALEYSRVQSAFARAALAGLPAQVVWGDALGMRCRRTGIPLGDGAFDRVLVKSASHEIPAGRQAHLYDSVFRVLKPGGLFVNLGFLFSDTTERDELREIARVKDRLAGMEAAVLNRHFPTRDEFYAHLERAGFTDIRAGTSFDYAIRSGPVARQYFKGEDGPDLEHQAAQARARTMRRNGRIRFEGDASLMLCPGEITLARRPGEAERNDRLFRDYPLELLRHVQAHAGMLGEAVRYLPLNAEVLDLGCGPGLLAERIPPGCRYTGIDLSPDFIEAVRKRLAGRPGLRFEAADFVRADLGKSRYDAATLLNVLNLPGLDAVGLLRRALEALKPGGRLIVSGPVSPDSFRKAEPLIRAQLERDGLLQAHAAAFRAVAEANARLLGPRANFWSPEGMVALLQRLGCRSVFSVDTRLYYGFSYMAVAER